MKILKKLIYFLSIVVILVCILYFVCFLIPGPEMKKSNQITIYDRNNNILLQTHKDLPGRYLKIDEINEDFIYGFIASEDNDFNNHIGFSFKGIVRAILNNIHSDNKQGGSTITQQLSRTLFLDNDKSLKRKIKEALITIRLETHYQKKEILEQYLNSIYLGHNIYGIAQASTYYFNKDNKELTIDEVAMIVGIANAPNINAPDINYTNALKRKNYVLKSLKDINYIDTMTYEKLIKKETKINICKLQIDDVSSFIYYYVINKLDNLSLNSKKILAKGIKVYTTIDLDIQKELFATISKNNPHDNSQISAIVMKSNSNDILAMVSSYDLNDQYNRAINAKRPISSTIKPLLYYLALKCNFKPTTLLDCKEKVFNIEGYESYIPTNATNTYAINQLNMVKAIGLSDNIYATKTLLFVGIDNMTKLLNKFGIDCNCVPSSALGVDEMSLLELTSIYNCFSSLGKYYEPSIINKIIDENNQLIYLADKSSKTILEKPFVFILNQLLRAPFDKNLIDYTKPTLLNYQTNNYFAAKTGTDNYNSYTIGFNPEYTIGIWTGTDLNEPFYYKSVSKKVFQEIANKITNKNYWYNMPSYLEEIEINNSIYWQLKEC